ncbi:MAG TPA: VTT domain-containing protein [Vicinamibacteria bacterium]
MKEFLDSVVTMIVGLGSIGGGFGLFFIAFCDSSFLSLPEVNDLLLVYFSVRFREQAYFYAIMAAVGSATGSTVLYWLGRSRGHRFLMRRYSESRLTSVLAVFHRYGVLALIGPALLPPPFPFKIFVLSAGLFGIPFGRFLGAVLLGRTVRYVVEAWLALRYGERAIAYFGEHYLQLVLLVVSATFAVAAVYVVASFIWRRRGASSANP